MLQVVKKFFSFLVTANIYIAFAAICLSCETYLLLDQKLKCDGLLSIIFFSTLFIYNHHRFIALRNNLFYQHATIVSLFGLIISAFYCPLKIILILIPLGFISFAYSVPLIRNKYGFVRLREIPGLKIFFLSLVWTLATVLLPILNLNLEFFTWPIFLTLTRRMLFVFAICIPFDIRDMQNDLRGNLRTLPVIMGERNAKILSLIALLCFFLLALFQFRFETFFNHALAFLLSSVITAMLVIKTYPWRKDFFYSVLIDGTMILQFLLVAVSLVAK